MRAGLLAEESYCQTVNTAIWCLFKVNDDIIDFEHRSFQNDKMILISDRTLQSTWRSNITPVFRTGNRSKKPIVI